MAKRKVVPTEIHEIDWKFQSKVKDKDYAVFVPYVNARSLMEWLDDHFVTWWEDTEFHKTFHHDTGKKVIEQHIFKCTLIAFDADGNKHMKTGMSPSTDIEPTKGGESDAFKRAGTKLGFGRDLYRYPKVLVQVDNWNNNWNKDEALEEITRLFVEGKVLKGRTVHIDMDGVMRRFEYGKPQAHKVLYPIGAKSTAKEEPELPPGEYSLDFVKKNLLNQQGLKRGELSNKIVDNILDLWKDGDRKIHYDKYIQAYSTKLDRNIWFELTDEQLKLFKKNL